MLQVAGRPTEERAVSATCGRQALREGGLPLRLLTDFSIFVREDGGNEEPARLEELRNGDSRCSRRDHAIVFPGRSSCAAQQP